MYPSPERPEYGVFVARLANALRARGHEVDEAVLRSGRRGRIATPVVYAGLLARTLSTARRTKPDVVYAHYLVPPGLIAAATGRPLVVTAHGGDVRNARSSRLLGLLTKVVIREKCWTCFRAGSYCPVPYSHAFSGESPLLALDSLSM